MENRRTRINRAEKEKNFRPIEGIDRTAEIAVPIIASGDVSGAVLLMTGDTDTEPGEAELKMTQAAALFLGRVMEDA